MPEKTPSLFSLMSKLTAEARQKLGERRRELKKQGATEELRQEKGVWKLVYAQGKERIEEIDL